MFISAQAESLIVNEGQIEAMAATWNVKYQGDTSISIAWFEWISIP